MNEQIWKSKLAMRLVRTFSALIAAAIAATVLIIAHDVHRGIVSTIGTIGNVNKQAVNEAGEQFQRLGAASSRQSSERTAQISINGLKSMSGTMEQTEIKTMSATVSNFSAVCQKSLDGAIEKSTETNRASLNQLSDRITALVSQSTQNAQRRAAQRVENSALSSDGAELDWRAKDAANDIRQYIQIYQDYLTLTSQMPQLSDGKMDGDRATLDALVRRYPMFTRVSELDSTGHEVVTSSSDEVITGRELMDYAGESFFKSAMAGESYIGVLRESSPDGAPVFRLAVPVEAYRGKVVAVLMANLSFLDLWDMERNTRIGKGGFVYVVNEKGIPLITIPHNHGKLLQRSAPIEGTEWKLYVAEPLAEIMQPVHSLQNDIASSSQQAVLQIRNSIRDSDRLTSASMSREAYNLHSATQSDLSAQSKQMIAGLRTTSSKQTKAELDQVQNAIEVQAGQIEQQNGVQMAAAAAQATQQLARRIPPVIASASRQSDEHFTLFALILTLVSCSIACLVSLYLAGRIVRPVVRLVQGTHAIASGDLGKRVDEKAPDEIGDLAAAFNQMAASLAKSRGDLQEAEAQLVQSAKLASLGTLSAGVAHELNQPLAIIRGVAQQLTKEPSLSEDAISDLKLIEGQTGRMSKIIKHLRTFCRAGGYELTQVDVNEVINNCFILIGAQLKAHNVEVKLELNEQERPVMADANELEQVFLNLITNARDALEEQDGACITIRSWKTDEQFVVEFRDNGRGIPENVARQIFDPFFTTKEAGKGTGLGLSISHSIIEKHHGTIEFRNDNGAVFTIQLPLAKTDSPEVVYAVAEAA